MNKKIKLVCFLTSLVLSFNALPLVVRADENATSTNPFVDMGMAAYVKLDSIDQTIFDNATDHFFESAEQSGTTYIIGTKTYYANDNYLASKTILHFYLATSGWLVAYLAADQPASAMVNWNDSASLEDNLLKLAIDEAVESIGASYVDSEIKYYNFQYPDATKMTLVRENIAPGEELTDEFTISVPGTIQEASYAMVAFEGAINSWSQAAVLTLDDTPVRHINIDNFLYGAYDSSIFTAGKAHKITLKSRDAECSIAAATLVLYSLD